MNYLANGQEVEVVSKVDDGYVVRPILEYGDGEATYLGDPFIVPIVLDEPATEKLHAQVAALDATIADKNRELRELRQQVTEAEKESKARMARLASHKALTRLEDFIAGKITHYAVFGEYDTPRIMTLEATKTDDEGTYRRDTFRLLSLFGRSNGDLEWQLNRYSDGSGSNHTVIPTTSEDDAKESVRDFLRTEGAKLGQPSHYPRRCFVDAAKQYGVELPAAYVERVQKAEQEGAQRQLAEAEQSLERARQRAVSCGLIKTEEPTQ